MLTGLSAFPVTPSDGRGRIDLDAFARLVARLAAAGVDSVGAMGSTGSYAYLDHAARAEALAVARVAAPGVPLLAGVGAPALSDVLRNARDAAEAGADALLLAPVTYQPLRPDEVLGLFRAVTAEAGLPVILYNNPSTTHVSFTPDLIAAIAALPGLVSVKMPPNPDPGPEIAALRARLAAGCTLGYSGDAMAAGALRAGAEAWYSVLAGLFPEPCLRMMRAAQAGDGPALAAFDARLAPVWRLFAATGGSYRAIHAAAGMLGFGTGTPPLPVLPLAGDELRMVEAALAEACLLETAA